MRTRQWMLAAAVLAAALAPAKPCSARGFALYANAYLDSARTSALRVTAEVPFKSLVFFKKQGWYDAQYEVYVSIERLDVKEKEPITAVMSGRAVARNYDDTGMLEHRSKVTRTFTLAPGRYRVDGSMRVHRTNVVMQRSLELEVPDFLATGIGFGTPVVIMVPSAETAGFSRWDDFERRRAVDDESEPDASLAFFSKRPAVRFQMYTDARASVGSCELFFEARSPGNEQVLYGKHQLDLRGEDDVFVLPIDVDDWEPGAYKINLRARASDPVREASVSVVLNVDVTRAMLGRDFDETLDILSLIATDEELAGLKHAAVGDRAAQWSKFWKSRDPDPTTPQNEALEEHLRRVRYVMKEYSNLGPGWRSDRGQVYIRYGPPDRIERTSDSRFQGEYEVWRYARGARVFVFYDMFGLGDYRLVQGEPF